MIRKPSTVADFREAARRRLPGAIFGTLEGGAGGELGLQRNLADLRKFHLIPRVLVDVEAVDLSTEILGEASELPLILGPTGLSGLYRRDGERLVADAAENVIYALSCFSSTSLEEVAAAGGGRKWFQLYPFRSRQLMRDLMRRARASGYEALCLTVDVPAIGNRYRDARSGIRAARPSLALIADAALHPRWSLPYLTGFRPRLASLRPYAEDETGGWLSLKPPPISASFTWKDLEWIVADWRGAVIVKGIMHPDDARSAFAAGARAIVVSNHGGRQLDAAPSPIAALPSIRAAVGPEAEVYADGGITSGEDILKYLAAGADACLVGRAYLYGLIVGGSAGVAAVIDIFRRELAIAMQLTGTTSLRRSAAPKGGTR